MYLELDYAVDLFLLTEHGTWIHIYPGPFLVAGESYCGRAMYEYKPDV
jgi:hypothetical protein